MRSVPMMPTGRIGQPTLSAKRAAPVWPLYKAPSRLRVPSGKMPKSSPLRSTASAVSSAEELFSPPLRSMGIMPIAGNKNLVFHESMYSALPTKLMSRPASSIKNALSRKLMWFGHKIAAPSAGKCSRPCRSKCQRRLATGSATFRARYCTLLVVCTVLLALIGVHPLSPARNMPTQ